MKQDRSGFLAYAALLGETVAIVTSLVLGWYMAFGADRLMALFLFPGFMAALSVTVFSLAGRVALGSLRMRFMADGRSCKATTRSGR